jgi:hypothetical protein
MFSNRKFIAIIDSKEYCCYNSSTPSLAARKFFSSFYKSSKIKNIKFYLKETTNKNNKKLYGPYIGKIKLNNNKYEISVKKLSKKIKGGYGKNDLQIQQLTNPEFIKKENDCLFFKPIFSGNTHYYQYIVCKTFFKDYQFKTIINNKIKNINIMMVDKESLNKLNEYIKKNNIFRSLQKIIEEIIQIKTTMIQKLQNKNIKNFDKKLIEEAFIQQLNEYNNNTVIILGPERIKMTKINGVTYIFFNPVPLMVNRNRNSNYYYRYFVFIKDNRIIFKEVFYNKDTSEINIREIDRINDEDLEKLKRDIDEIIRNKLNNSSARNIYNKIHSLSNQYAKV